MPLRENQVLAVTPLASHVASCLRLLGTSMKSQDMDGEYFPENFKPRSF